MITPRRASIGSIERALEVHERANRIRGWRHDSINGGWWVKLHQADDVWLRSKRDALLFIAGCASAGYATCCAGVLSGHVLPGGEQARMCDDSCICSECVEQRAEPSSAVDGAST